MRSLTLYQTTVRHQISFLHGSFRAQIILLVKWGPQLEQITFMNQAALLYTSYYFLQIIIHRSFMPLPRRPTSVSFPSLAICTNAARICIHIIDTQLSRTGGHPSLQAHWHPVCFRIVLAVSSHSDHSFTLVNIIHFRNGPPTQCMEREERRSSY